MPHWNLFRYLKLTCLLCLTVSARLALADEDEPTIGPVVLAHGDGEQNDVGRSGQMDGTPGPAGASGIVLTSLHVSCELPHATWVDLVPYQGSLALACDRPLTPQAHRMGVMATRRRPSTKVSQSISTRSWRMSSAMRSSHRRPSKISTRHCPRRRYGALSELHVHRVLRLSA
jgi:hypothetical protein